MQDSNDVNANTTCILVQCGVSHCDLDLQCFYSFIVCDYSLVVARLSYTTEHFKLRLSFSNIDLLKYMSI